MKINLKGNFDGNRKFSLKRIATSGILATAIALGGVATSNIDSHNNSNNDIILPDAIEVELEDINRMNIILNDCDCSDTFFEDVCCLLREEGVDFTVTNKNTDINQDNSVVITLDHQYSSGDSTLIIAPFDNTRIGNSDSLALSMQAALKENGFFADTIICGKIGYKEDKNGNITDTVPSETEENIESNFDTSFVTISFGTENNNPEWVAKSIKGGLARYTDYINNYYSQTDLLYRATLGEDIKLIAQYFDSNPDDLSSFNHLEGSSLSCSQPIINPKVSEIDVFDPKLQFTVDRVKTRAY